MASMDDTFKLRVEKIFGSLRSSTSTTPLEQRPSLWSLTDDEVERREWRRDADTTDRHDMPCSSSFDEFLKEERKHRNEKNWRKELEDDLEDVDDDGEGGDVRRKNDVDGDDWSIKSSIGLDRTLDNEEEEDEYDKVASGRDYAGKVYMSDINDHGLYLNSQNVLHGSANDKSKRDPRANYLAARMRLKEDDADARSSHHSGDTENKEPQSKSFDRGSLLRSILKRKDDNAGFKPQKRVRFDPSYENDSEVVSQKFKEFPAGTLSKNVKAPDGGLPFAEDAPKVPDYVLNPSRYTRYSLDSSEVDDESNTNACMDFLELVKKLKPKESGSELEDGQSDLPKVTFIPKKKSINVQAGNNGGEVQEMEVEGKQSLLPSGLPQGIAAGEAQQCEEGELEDDGAGTSAIVQKHGRSYRQKPRSDESDA
ncbi:hypothetical protein SLEP1_g6563 [Rubroshorea leprosula]|uniref:Protein TSSC4 n=1 Tax=Rubroshorea leprosula TaxID=152421 RepID=A0AAV5I1K9_9ROSI|nr:hypothetical protein SLEP1_g6563 [Rubroshorea leprosula]